MQAYHSNLSCAVVTRQLCCTRAQKQDCKNLQLSSKIQVWGGRGRDQRESQRERAIAANQGGCRAKSRRRIDISMMLLHLGPFMQLEPPQLMMLQTHECVLLFMTPVEGKPAAEEQVCCCRSCRIHIKGRTGKGIHPLSPREAHCPSQKSSSWQYTPPSNLQMRALTRVPGAQHDVCY